jgi:hypothetical protein
VELIIIPFFLPLLLVGRLIEAWSAYRGARASTRPVEPIAPDRWLETWFRRNGPPVDGPR